MQDIMQKKNIVNTEIFGHPYFEGKFSWFFFNFFSITKCWENMATTYFHIYCFISPFYRKKYWLDQIFVTAFFWAYFSNWLFDGRWFWLIKYGRLFFQMRNKGNIYIGVHFPTNLLFRVVICLTKCFSCILIPFLFYELFI